nr:hypothetical protein Iba_chr07aCG5930 [Ipomoea batatas]
MFLCMIEWNPGVLLRSNFVYLSEALSWIDARMVLGAYVDDLIIFRLVPERSQDVLSGLCDAEMGELGADYDVGSLCIAMDVEFSLLKQLRSKTELRSEVGFWFSMTSSPFRVLSDAIGLARKTTTKDRNGEEEWVEPEDYGVKWAFGFLWLRLHFCGGRVGLAKKTKHGNGEEVCVEAKK